MFSGKDHTLIIHGWLRRVALLVEVAGVTLAPLIAFVCLEIKKSSRQKVYTNVPTFIVALSDEQDGYLWRKQSELWFHLPK